MTGAVWEIARWKKWLLWFVGWTVIALFQSIRVYHVYGGDLPWCASLALSAIEWYLWALLAVLVVRISLWARFDRGHWIRSSIIHLVSACVICTVQIVLFLNISGIIMPMFEENFATWFGQAPSFYIWAMGYRLFYALMTYSLVAFVTYSIALYKRYRDEQQRLMAIESTLTRSRLEMLKSQLHPHFLFNTLNAIAALIHIDPEGADRMVTKLSELLRSTIDESGAKEVPLRNEIEFIDRYLDIQLVRFRDRLQTHKDIPPDVFDALIPSLLLQPLVENAIVHGMKRRTDSVEVRIMARRENDSLRITISDNGPGVTEELSELEKKGRGLANTRERLERMYGSSQRLSVTGSPEDGTTAKIVIPFRTESDTEEIG